MHPGEAHLTVAIVDWTTPYKRKRKGLCSTYLASLTPQQRPPPPPGSRGLPGRSRDKEQVGEEQASVTGGMSTSVDCYSEGEGREPEPSQVAVWVERGGALRMPADPCVPLILIGPGTGVAPFRSFLEERTAMLRSCAASSSHNGMPGKDRTETAPSLLSHVPEIAAAAAAHEVQGPAACSLFLGCRGMHTDCYYLDQWKALQQEGVLLRATHGLAIAASRDQPTKVRHIGCGRGCCVVFFLFYTCVPFIYVCLLSNTASSFAIWMSLLPLS